MGEWIALGRSMAYQFMKWATMNQFMRRRCNRRRCPLARLSGLQCYTMGHNGHGINLYGVIMALMGNLDVGGQSSLGDLSLLHRNQIEFFRSF